MAKIAVFKVELATGDRASHAIIKATIQATIRSLGVADVAPAPEADPPLPTAETKPEPKAEPKPTWEGPEPGDLPGALADFHEWIEGQKIPALAAKKPAPAAAKPGLLDDDRTAWYSSAQVKQWVNPAKPKAS